MSRKHELHLARVACTLIVASVLLITACTSIQQGGGANGRKMPILFQGVLNLALSVVQIAVGLSEGVSALPYYAGTALKDINNGMIQAKAKITLDDTYESAYGKRISQVDPSGDTGETFRRMKHASEYFQKVLTRYGVENPAHYFLASIDTANKQGYTLFAVVYRKSKNISVIDKYNGSSIRNFSSDDRLFYEPFEFDAKGNPLDVIVDWAGLPLDQYGSQKQQAILLTLAANAAVSDRKRTDYWAIEKRWIDGEFIEIMNTQNDKVKQAMKL